MGVNFSKFNNFKIKKKLMIAYFIGGVFPIVILFFVLSTYLFQEYQEKEALLIDEAMTRVDTNMTFLLDDVYSLSSRFLAMYSTKYEYSELSNLTEYEEIDLLKEVEIEIKTSKYCNPYIENLIIYHNGTDINVGSSIKAYSYELLEDPLKSFIDSKDFFEINDESHKFEFYRNLNPFTNKKINIMKMTLTNQSIQTAFDDNWIKNNSGQLYLLDDSDHILYTTASESSGEKFEDVIVTSEYLMQERPFEYKDYITNYKLVLIYKKEKFLQGKKIVVNQIIVLAFVTILLPTVFIFAIGKNINHRLGVLNNVMHSNEEDKLDILEEDLGNDEIGETGKLYNKLIKQINQLIYMDTLTGLQNKFAIDNTIEKAINLNNNHVQKTVLFLDLDYFKDINDRYGHDVGDLVIKEVGIRFKKFESKAIEIGRFGGDEFLLLIHDSYLEGSIEDLIIAIRKAISIPIAIEDKHISLTASIGIAIYPIHGINKNDIIKKADLALYNSKAKGRNCYSYFEEYMSQNLDEKLFFQEKVTSAFKKEELYLSYQPYVETATKKVIGYEAFVRWNSSVFGQVSPAELIAIVEKMGLIAEIGDWIFETACRFAKKINEIQEQSISISINISAMQLMDQNFPERIAQITKKIGISPDLILLEMKESFLIEALKRGRQTSQQLKELGFKIVLDDFSTSDTSFRNLEALPIDLLKIHKTIVKDILNEAYNKELITTIIKIAHKRGIQVIGEGVELEAQYKYLYANDCDMIQGYYFGESCNEEEIL